MIPTVPRETQERLSRLKALVLEEATRQNLVAASSIPQFEQRHIDDSLQLLPHIAAGAMLDIGSGAGFPGLVLACCRTDPVHLVEPRAKRAAFLASAVDALGIADHTHVHKCAVERLRIDPVATITARAVAALPALFAMAAHLADSTTRWVLPKGRTASTELEEAKGSWQGVFRLIPSATDPEAAIVLAEAVRRRMSR
jgi:16S rRNA (guanine527-N7)-methyltransferase